MAQKNGSGGTEHPPRKNGSAAEGETFDFIGELNKLYPQGIPKAVLEEATFYDRELKNRVNSETVSKEKKLGQIAADSLRRKFISDLGKDVVKHPDLVNGGSKDVSKKIEDRSGGYVALQKEVTALLKQKYPDGVPAHIDLAVSDIEGRYRKNIGAGRNKDVQEKIVEDLRSIFLRETSPAESSVPEHVPAVVPPAEPAVLQLGSDVDDSKVQSPFGNSTQQQIDLAQTYFEMGDTKGAHKVVEEGVQQGLIDEETANRLVESFKEDENKSTDSVLNIPVLKPSTSDSADRVPDASSRPEPLVMSPRLTDALLNSHPQTSGPLGSNPATPKIVFDRGGALESPDDRIEPTLGETSTIDGNADLAQAGSSAQTQEGTRVEHKQRLRGLVERIEKLAQTTKESVGKGKERFASLKNYLSDRSAGLDAQAAKMGRIEKGFRWLGEEYNKLDWKGKLAVGLALGVGGGLTMTAGSAWAFAFVGGSILQRAAGLSGKFMQYEAKGNSKEMAMFKAVGYTVAMGAAMAGLMYGVKEVSKFENVERIKDAVGKLFGGENKDLPTASEQSPAPKTYPMPRPEPPPSPAELPPEAPETQSAEKPEIAKEAPKPSAPAAPAQSIARPDVMTPRITSDGSTHGVPEELRARIDSALAARVETSPQVPEAVEHVGGLPRIGMPMEHVIPRMEYNLPAEPEQSVPTPEAPAPISEPPAPETSAPVPESTPAPAASPDTSPFTREEYKSLEDAYNAPRQPGSFEAPPQFTGVVDEGASQAPAAPEAPTSAAPEVNGAQASPEVVTNSSGVEIRLKEAHTYEGAGKSTIVFGGSPTERAKLIQEYLLKNPTKEVIASDDKEKYQLRWRLRDGKAVVDEIKRTWLGGFAKPLSPDDLRKIVK
jgi:FimV-like protein